VSKGHPGSNIQKNFPGKSPKNVNLNKVSDFNNHKKKTRFRFFNIFPDKTNDETDNFDKKARIFRLALCRKCKNSKINAKA